MSSVYHVRYWWCWMWNIMWILTVSLIRWRATWEQRQSYPCVPRPCLGECAAHGEHIVVSLGTWVHGLFGRHRRATGPHTGHDRPPSHPLSKGPAYSRHTDRSIPGTFWSCLLLNGGRYANVTITALAGSWENIGEQSQQNSLLWWNLHSGGKVSHLKMDWVKYKNILNKRVSS